MMLSNCPFCAASAAAGRHSGCIAVQCQNSACGATGALFLPGASKKTATAAEKAAARAWNNRATAPAPGCEGKLCGRVGCYACYPLDGM